MMQIFMTNCGLAVYVINKIDNIHISEANEIKQSNEHTEFILMIIELLCFLKGKELAVTEIRTYGWTFAQLY